MRPLPRTPAAAEQPAAPAVPQPRPAPAPAPVQQPAPGRPGWAQRPPAPAAPAAPAVPVAPARADENVPVVPWKPPVEDPFLAAARAQAAARPAGLGRRLAARLVDTLVVGAVTAAAAVPLTSAARDHLDAKIEAAKLSGRTVTVWLLDGTTAGYLAAVLGVLLLFGVVYEALPTAKWGRTLGKKLFGLRVQDIEEHDAPAFGAALKRWLVYSVPGLLVVGVVGVLWCLFDQPWRQCWHDKAARTFVAR
ncbi:RDD family protein [Streptomyces sp. ADI96-15]|nr:RDD family protein [Streptomyces sp. ADI96-15]